MIKVAESNWDCSTTVDPDAQGPGPGAGKGRAAGQTFPPPLTEAPFLLTGSRDQQTGHSWPAALGLFRLGLWPQAKSDRPGDKSGGRRQGIRTCAAAPTWLRKAESAPRRRRGRFVPSPNSQLGKTGGRRAPRPALTVAQTAASGASRRRPPPGPRRAPCALLAPPGPGAATPQLGPQLGPQLPPPAPLAAASRVCHGQPRLRDWAAEEGAAPRPSPSRCSRLA